MRDPGAPWKSLALWLALSTILVAFLQGLRLVVEAPFSWRGLLIHWVFVVGLLFAARWTQPYLAGMAHQVWPWPGLLAAGAGAGATVVYAMSRATWAAWIMMGVLYLLLLGLETVLTNGRDVLQRWGMRALVIAAGGAIPVSIAQIESHFADEEFFVALQALALSLFCTLLLAARGLLARQETKPMRHGLHFDRRWVALGLNLLAFAGLCGTVRAYQHSFYPSHAPLYEGISAESPFLCGQAPPDAQIFDGVDVFRRLLARVEANPYKGSPEYGMLALGTGRRHWAQAFRESLLSEIARRRYTGPAHSVKSVQYEAALRAYYYPRVRSAFPDLFTSVEEEQVRQWFATINRRALTVEWVDWMYALAFTKRPEGPYENQENGAGLLAVLESEGLAAPELSLANRNYLKRDRRGWIARFRNTDDAFIYQPEWINNAYFQSLYTGEASKNNTRLSFEWLLLQALPDGAPLRYNHPGRLSLGGIAYLGARLLEDPRYVWLAGQALADVEAQGGYLFAQPGVERPVSLVGRSPTLGSCLLYGGSGLPNQAGPLAPDKIVFRDGWTEDSAYLLFNLRFTGWHRYKAANTVTAVYQDGLLVADVLDGKPFTWLPVGRSVFRDKRIPRENLNGLLIERSGMDAVLYVLTGVGGPWAQDPPYYAEVVAFETGDELDWSHIRLTDWHGWQHDRWIYFYHDGGPIVVIDEAEGPQGDEAALTWHIVGDGTMKEQRIRLRSGDEAAEMLFIPLAPGGRLEVAREVGSDFRMRVVYYAPTDGRPLHAVTLLLPGQWVGADAELDTEEKTLRVTQGQTYITLPVGWKE